MNVEVYDLRYAQTVNSVAGDAESGPSIGTLWNRAEAEAIAARAGETDGAPDLVVVAIDLPEHVAEAICQ